MIGSTTEVMDDLTYNYTNTDNQLTSITESGLGNNLSGYPLSAGTGAVMQYDNNGNMTTQADKGITNIAYNLLNLPSVITTNNNQNASYFYRADGTKVKKVANGKTTDYLDGFQYVNGVLQFFATAEGYYDYPNGRYVYNYTDHLGNVRISFTKNTSGVAVVLEENNYYPFGLKHNSYNTGSTANANYTYKYNGKEFQENGQYDYGARFYMADIGRWGTVDPLAEHYRRWSPYNYAVDNPIRYIDPDGRGTYDANGNWHSEMESYYDYFGYSNDYKPAYYSKLDQDAGGSTGGDSSGDSNVTIGDLLAGLNHVAHEITVDILEQNKYDYTNNGEYFKSQEELESYINKNVGNFNSIEKALNVDIQLAAKDNLPSGYWLEGNDIVNSRGPKGGITVPNGVGSSRVFISPSAKGDYFGNVRATSQTIVHELIHAYHHFKRFSPIEINLYSEYATSTYTFTYLKAYGSRNGASYYYHNVKPYPSYFNWRNLPSIIKTGLK